MSDLQIAVVILLFWIWFLIVWTQVSFSRTRSHLKDIESKLDKLHKQQMIFVDAVTRLVKALEKEDED